MSNKYSRNFAIVLLAVILQSGSFSVDAYLPNSASRGAFRQRLSCFSPVPSSPSSLASSTTDTTTRTDFSTFANSLESDFDDEKDDPMRSSASTTKNNDNEKPWQAKLDDLFDPTTNLADRQILLSELLTSNDKIRDDVLDALTNRKVRDKNIISSRSRCAVLCRAVTLLQRTNSIRQACRNRTDWAKESLFLTQFGASRLASAEFLYCLHAC
jgi:hypothetical protein